MPEKQAAKAIIEYGDDVESIAAKYGDDVADCAKKIYTEFGDATNGVSRAVNINYKSTLSKFDAEGYDDFIRRTEGMFTSEEEAQKAFQQLLDRDFEGFANNFDFSTQPNKAYFWSGDKALADKIAKSNGGTTMEGTPGGKVLDDWEWLEKKYPSANWDHRNDLDPKPLWQAVSKKYANGVSGKVTYVNQDYEGTIWLEDESGILDDLMDDGVVSEIDYYNKEYLINKILDEGERG